MKIGNIDVTSMKIGSTNVAKAYVGSTQVYPSSQPTPTGYTYSVTITGLENGDTTNIDWEAGSYVDYGVGNGTYTYTSANDSIGVDISNVQDYTVDYGSFWLYDYDPSKTVTFTYQGGGGGCTYTVEITGLQNGDSTDIVWDGGSYVDSSVGNGIYRYSSQNDFMLVEVLNYSQDYQVSGAIVLSHSNPSGTITFSKVGGLTHIPQGEDMSQFFNQQITRFKIGDSSFPSGYQTVSLNFLTGGSGNIGGGWWQFTFDNTLVNSLPCNVTGSDAFTNWNCFNSSWQLTTENPFTDLWIEFA